MTFAERYGPSGVIADHPSGQARGARDHGDPSYAILGGSQ